MNQSQHLEQVVLSTLIKQGQINDITSEGYSKLKPEYFAYSQEREIFEAIQAHVSSNREFGLINLADYLGTAKQVFWGSSSNAMGILATIMDNSFSDSNFSGYISKLKDKHILRQIAAKTSTVNEIVSNSGDDKEKIKESLTLLSANNYDDDENLFLSGTERAESFIDRLQSRIQSQSDLAGLSFGYEKLDKLTGGAADADLIAICGKPSSGKSCLMMNIQQAAIMRGDSSLFFSAEMPDAVVTDRDVAALAEVPLSKIRSGNFFRDGDQSLDEMYFAKIGQAQSELQKAPYTVVDKGGLHIADIENMTRTYTIKNGAPKWIFVDYWQIIKGDGKTPLEQRADVSMRLKALAKELDTRVVLGAQLRKDARGWPDCSMIKDSAKLEEDADIILFVHSDNDLMKPVQGQQTAVIIGKCRNGECGVMPTNPKMNIQKFEEINGEYEQSEPEKKSYF